MITAGGFHSFAALENGSVRCWGDNDAGQLGYGDTDDRGDNAGEMGDSLAQIDLGAGRTAPRCRRQFSFVRGLDNGAIKCWGANDVGQLGYGDSTTRGDNAGEMRQPPTRRSAAAAPRQRRRAGDSDSRALLDNGTVRGCGANDVGRARPGRHHHPR